MGRAERVVDVDVAESGQTRSEVDDGSGVGLGLCPVLLLDGTLFLDVETEIFEKDDGTSLGRPDGYLDLWANAVVKKDDWSAEVPLEFGRSRLERVLLDWLAIGTAEMGHEHDDGGIYRGVSDGGCEVSRSNLAREHVLW